MLGTSSGDSARGHPLPPTPGTCSLREAWKQGRQGRRSHCWLWVAILISCIKPTKMYHFRRKSKRYAVYFLYIGKNG